MLNYRPRESLQNNEFWMPYLDFLRHFSDLIVCSSAEPFKPPDCSAERLYFDEQVSTPVIETPEKAEMLTLPSEIPRARKRSVEILISKDNYTPGRNEDPPCFIRRTKSYREKQRKSISSKQVSNCYKLAWREGDFLTTSDKTADRVKGTEHEMPRISRKTSDNPGDDKKDTTTCIKSISYAECITYS